MYKNNNSKSFKRTKKFRIGQLLQKLWFLETFLFRFFLVYFEKFRVTIGHTNYETKKIRPNEINEQDSKSIHLVNPLKIKKRELESINDKQVLNRLITASFAESIVYRQTNFTLRNNLQNLNLPRLEIMKNIKQIIFEVFQIFRLYYSLDFNHQFPMAAQVIVPIKLRCKNHGLKRKLPGFL